MKDFEDTLEGVCSGDWWAGPSPRLLRRATPSSRGLGLAWFFGSGFGLDFLAGGTEVVHHFSVLKANQAHAELLEGSGASSVSSQSFRGVMLRAVQFYDQFERRAVKVSDEPPNRSLPHPAHRLDIQKPIPELALRWSESCSQHLRSRRQSFVIRQPSHPKTLQHLTHPNPLPEGVALRSRRGERPAHQSQPKGHP